MAEQTIDNPFWDEAKDHVAPDTVTGAPTVGELRNLESAFVRREELTSKYAWTITDPATVEFVATHAGSSLVDPMAGSGYWGYLLRQMGVDAICYDRAPARSLWHAGKLWVDVETMDGAESVLNHPDRTLLLAWPPYDTPDGFDTLAAYGGDRVIYIGEHDGCTGDEDLREALETKWKEVCCHRPVQWFGIRDWVTVYDRG